MIKVLPAQIPDIALRAMLRSSDRMIVFIFYAVILSNVISAFSQELSVSPQDKPGSAVDEEIRWLQAEAFDLDVILASRKSEKLFKTAAAIYVITQEDIRNSSATNIPELLRMVPGINVARIDANKWGVTSRGFNNRFANKLLVQIDGRIVYTLLEFSGTNADRTQSTEV
ncbi:MAG: TonB-dependent receptor plug domain-containing protein [Candidatus Scalindua sp.]|nr:TonB-dependent receptor plug domain-containing protein [Candidatus Scalindua sp.]